MGEPSTAPTTAPNVTVVQNFKAPNADRRGEARMAWLAARARPGLSTGLDPWLHAGPCQFLASSGATCQEPAIDADERT